MALPENPFEYLDEEVYESSGCYCDCTCCICTCFDEEMYEEANSTPFEED